MLCVGHQSFRNSTPCKKLLPLSLDHRTGHGLSPFKVISTHSIIPGLEINGGPGAKAPYSGLGPPFFHVHGARGALFFSGVLCFQSILLLFGLRSPFFTLVPACFCVHNITTSFPAFRPYLRSPPAPRVKHLLTPLPCMWYSSPLTAPYFPVGPPTFRSKGPDGLLTFGKSISSPEYPSVAVSITLLLQLKIVVYSLKM